MTAEDDASFSSNQKDSATKQIPHCTDALERNDGQTVCLCFPSGDTDITVLHIALLQEFKDRVFIIGGRDANKEQYRLNDSDTASGSASALLGFHASMGYGYPAGIYLLIFGRKSTSICSLLNLLSLFFQKNVQS